MSFTQDEIAKIAHLARLEINDKAHIAKELDNILVLINQIEQVDTDHLTPMAHSQDTTQRLRQDQVTETNVRESMLSISPSNEAGLYLVPQVIE